MRNQVKYGGKLLLRNGARAVKEDITWAALVVLFKMARDGRILKWKQLTAREILSEVISNTEMAALLKMNPKSAAGLVLLRIVSSSNRLIFIRGAVKLMFAVYENENDISERSKL